MQQKTNYTIDISSNTIWRFVLIGLLLVFLYLVRDIIFLVFVAFILMSAAQPVVDKLEKKKIPRVLSALTIYLGFLLVFATILYFIIPYLAIEIKKLGNNIPVYLQGLNEFINQANFYLTNNEYQVETEAGNALTGFSNNLTNFVSQIFSNTFAFFGGFIKTIVVFSLSFYMLVKKDGIKGFLRIIVPKKNMAYIFDLIDRIQYKMGRWLIGQFSLVLFVFSLDFLALYFLGVPYAIIIAIFGGLLEIIPYVGPMLAAVPAILLGLTVSPFTALLVAIFYLLIQQAENHILTPLIMKKAVGLNPVIIILALLIGAKLAGFLGILIAVPLATAISIFIKDLTSSKKEKTVFNK